MIWGLTMSSPGAHTTTDNRRSKEEVNEDRKTNGYEAGWYLPGIEDPEVLEQELNPDEEKNGLNSSEFYKLLEKLSSEDSLSDSEPNSDASEG